MSSLPAGLKQSSRVLRQLLLVYWLGSTLLLTVLLALFNLWEHKNLIVHEGDQATHLVQSLLRTPMGEAQRQQLLEAHGQAGRDGVLQGVNVLLVLDRSGRIIHSSRPTWRQLSITDPLFDRMEGDDPDFQEVVSCFRRNGTDCIFSRSADWHLHLAGFTVVRSVWKPAMALGLPRQPFLVLINFDAGVLLGDFLQDLPLNLLQAALVASLLSGGLWFSLSGLMLPKLLELTQTDALTQLMNRTSFMELAMDQLAEAEERQGDLVFAILDIDHFKRINDTYGHGCGDEALASVGRLLLAVTRPEDLVCRFGGEEFALLLSAPREAGGKVLERLRLQLEMNRLLYRGHRIPLTVSIGAAATSQCGHNIDFLYNAADKALYAAKHGGRNRLEWNSGELVSRLPLMAAANP